MNRDSTPGTDSAILAEQSAYYRDRAGEYDEWWFRTGRYDRGEELNAAWFKDVAAVESHLATFLDVARPRSALELACGTGLFTRLLAPKVGCLTAIDSSPEVIAINRDRVGAANVDYIECDVFEWQPRQAYDLVFMSFWLSHVPMPRFDDFWGMVRAGLAPGGAAYVVDSALDPTSTARDHPRPDAETGIVTRKLNDGRQYRIVKIFHEPATLNARLATLGLAAKIARTPRYFIHGPARSTATGS